MINEKEITAVNLSATKKDFYQIWNELLDTASKLSERWDPTSTNESDPGIVLLKVLTAIADKLNYTIDKNTLEAFMPSAAQEDSMRKLCDMMGYNMKYYQSATTDATFTYVGEPDITEYSITIPKYTSIKNADDDINYVTLDDIIIGGEIKSQSVECIEGEVITCAQDTDNIVSIDQLDDANRYYLPEATIAENGIFITNYNDSTVETSLWDKVDNLNTQEVGKHCFKFGFDSRTGMPYVQFPEDIATIIEDGLVIRYTRTNGANGNISARTLSKFDEPSDWSAQTTNDDTLAEILKIENFTVTNPSATINGKNKESLNDAYSNYKRTIGTFDTLVTCRDYMNKIYQMTTDDANMTPLVSNIIVSDIRDDINKAITLCSFNEYGIAYVDHSLKNAINGSADCLNTLQNYGSTTTPKVAVGEIYYAGKEDSYYQCTSVQDSTSDWALLENFSQQKISHFDLILYPFTTITGNYSQTAYENSFKYTTTNKSLIEKELEKIKTISHNLTYPEAEDVVCIVNYLQLKAKITTKAKVNTVEETSILNNIYSAIYENFNARKLDFGEEIPFDTILNVIQNADTRIKASGVALEEPILVTKFRLRDGEDVTTAAYYNRFALRNVLAGRLPLFEYDESFKPDYTETIYRVNGTTPYKPVYGPEVVDDPVKDYTKFIGSITSNFKLNACNEAVKLNENEVIQFRAPNFKTTKTFPAYVNYVLNCKAIGGEAGKPATFYTLRDFMDYGQAGTTQSDERWLAAAANANIRNGVQDITIVNKSDFYAKKTLYGRLFKYDGSTYSIIPDTEAETTTACKVFAINEKSYGGWFKFIQSYSGVTGSGVEHLSGLYRSLGADASRQIGRLVDASYRKYICCYTYIIYDSMLDNYYIQVTHSDDTADHTKNGLGLDATYSGIKENEEYFLDSSRGEFLLINYTPSTTDSGSENQTSLPVNLIITDKVIKPNFNLLDSAVYKQAGHTPSKTTGYTFTGDYLTKINDVGGMYTLGTNEQIELREQVIITLNDAACYVYWERNDEDKLAIVNKDYIKFEFNETYNGQANMAYTLKEGEYFYYTDSSKLDMAYYGNGTRIIRSDNTPDILKKKQNSTTLADDIANLGLLAALPWEVLSLNNTNQKLELWEYQYVTLTEGDTIHCILTNAGGDITQDKIEIPLDSEEWYSIGTAAYTFSDEETLNQLPRISIDPNITWEGKGLLNLNTAAANLQTLHASNKSIADNDETSLKTEDSITINYYKYNSDTKKEEFVDSYTVKPIANTATTKFEDLSIKTNYLCQAYSGKADTHVYSYDSDGNIDLAASKNDFGVKVFKYNTLTGDSASGTGGQVKLTTGNFGDGHWTKVNFSTIKTFGLNITLPTEKMSSTATRPTAKGMVMVYYIDENFSLDNIEKGAYLTISSATPVTPTICNADTANEVLFDSQGWWKNYKKAAGSTFNYHLKPGMNIIELSDSCTVTFNADEKKNGTVIISDLDLVKLTYYTEGSLTKSELKINNRIAFRSENDNVRLSAQVLEKIRTLDPTYTFYYNAVMDNSTAIDLNTNITDTTDAAYETLATPSVWYDYNNINNKFVISEISVDDMKKGIVLTNSSKR